MSPRFEIFRHCFLVDAFIQVCKQVHEPYEALIPNRSEALKIRFVPLFTIVDLGQNQFADQPWTRLDFSDLNNKIYYNAAACARCEAFGGFFLSFNQFCIFNSKT